MTLEMILIFMLSCIFYFFVIKFAIRIYKEFKPNKKSRRRVRPASTNFTNQKTYSNPEQDPNFYKTLANEINNNGDVIYNGSVGYGFMATESDLYMIKETSSGRDEKYIGSLDYVYHVVPDSLDVNPLVKDTVAGFYDNYEIYKENYNGYI